MGKRARPGRQESQHRKMGTEGLRGKGRGEAEFSVEEKESEGLWGENGVRIAEAQRFLGNVVLGSRALARGRQRLVTSVV